MSKLAIIGAACLLTLSIGNFAKADEPAKGDEKQVEKKADKGEKGEEKAAKKEEGKASGASSITCKNGGDTRTLTKKDMEGGGCEVMYNKGGEDKSIAQAKNDVSYCDKTMEKVKDNLTKSGFTCE
jgi:hypothetical protein